MYAPPRRVHPYKHFEGVAPARRPAGPILSILTIPIPPAHPGDGGGLAAHPSCGSTQVRSTFPMISLRGPKNDFHGTIKDFPWPFLKTPPPPGTLV